MSASVVVLMCGPSFSGKSTIARRIAERHGAQRVSLDEINARRGLSGGFAIPPEEWARSHEIARQELARILDTGANLVVIDDTNCFRFLRDAFRGVAEAHGARVVIVVPDADADEILSRAISEADEAANRGVRPEDIRRQIATFEWPGDDESTLRCPPDQSVNKWLDTQMERYGL